MGQYVPEGFGEFYESWLSEQDEFLSELVAASRQPHTDHETQVSQLTSLVDRVVHHYEEYYHVKAQWAEVDILRMFSPTWTSSLEDAFSWVGGWRPSTAFHLLYSVLFASQTEATLAEILRGVRVDNLIDITLDQFLKVDKLKQKTVEEEREVSEELAIQHEAGAESDIVALSHEISELMAQGKYITNEHEKNIDSVLAEKGEGFKEVLRMADDLRIRTLKEIIGILDPIQAVHFLIAAAELHLRVNEWGMQRDANQAPNHQPSDNGQPSA